MKRCLSLVAIALALALSINSWAAPKAAPCASFSLSANPATVAAGGWVTISVTITSCSVGVERLLISYEVVGPCNYSDAYSVSLTLTPGETRSASVTLPAPTCAGQYTITANVFSGQTFLTTASTSFTVQ